MRIGVRGILCGLPIVAAPLLAQAPLGWRVSADSQVNLDSIITHSGNRSGRVRGLSAGDFVTLRQGLSPDSVSGRRVRFSGYVRTNLVSGTAGLWMRVDGPGPNEILSFDNMSSRPIVGVTPWTRYEIVLDVPSESVGIVLGVLMVGHGDVWLDDVLMEPVGREVAATNMAAAAASGAHHAHEEPTPAEKERIAMLRRSAPWRLRNPGFEERP